MEERLKRIRRWVIDVSEKWKREEARKAVHWRVGKG